MDARNKGQTQVMNTGGNASNRQSLATTNDRRSDNPFSVMRRLSDEMDQIFNRFGFGGGLLSPWAERGILSDVDSPGVAAWSPQVELFQRGNELVVRADVPGMHKE